MTKRILIAEDDPFLGKVAGNTLKSEGFEIDRAVDGVDALEKIKSAQYDLILLDLIMPKKDGFEVLKQLKAMNISTPVYIFSNLSQPEDKEEVKRLGAKKFFVKSGLRLADLVEAVRKEVK